MAPEAAVTPPQPAKPPLRIVRGGDELAFLPAALEIIETPASPLGRSVAWTIIAFFVVALVWACIGHIDIIATAQGRPRESLT